MHAIQKMLIIFMMMPINLALSEIDEKPLVEDNGTIHMPAFNLPESSFLTQESRAALKYLRDVAKLEWKAIYEQCPSIEGPDFSTMAEIRQCRANHFYQLSTTYKKNA